MSDRDDIAAIPTLESPPALEPERRAVMDQDDRLRPDFVARVLDAVEAGDNETARALVEPLHPADVADLIELAAADERE